MNAYMMSFADPNRPTGTQWLGTVLVEAPTLEQAVTDSHLKGINPGGEIAVYCLGPDLEIDPKWRDRLLSLEDLAQMPQPRIIVR